jgi:hypothetical protein
MAALLNSVRAKGPLNRAHTYKAAVHKGRITRPDRPDLSAVRSSLLPDEAAPETFMAMQGDHVL